MRCSVVILSCAFLLVGCQKSAGKKEDASDGKQKEPSSGLVQGVLDNIREPEEKQFEEPDAVVRFLIEQIIAQDFDEATKAFPVRERYENITLARSTEYQRMFNYDSMPVPGADFHNLQLAMDGLDLFNRLSVICMGFNPDYRRNLPENSIPEATGELKEQLDFSQLEKLEIKNSNGYGEQEVSESQLLLKAMGVTHLGKVSLTVSLEGDEFYLDFDVIKIGSNWRIGGLADVSGLPAPPSRS